VPTVKSNERRRTVLKLGIRFDPLIQAVRARLKHRRGVCGFIPQPPVKVKPATFLVFFRMLSAAIAG
jgi:hypothetical protein